MLRSVSYTEIQNQLFYNTDAAKGYCIRLTTTMCYCAAPKINEYLLASSIPTSMSVLLSYKCQGGGAAV